MCEILLKRTYDDKGSDDGYRVLIDRLWPRGIAKEDLSYSWWPKDIAPSDELRKAFGHDKDKFSDFKKKYKKELDNNDLKDEFLEKIDKQLEKHNVTFLYAAKDEEHNQAVVLKEWTEDKLNK